MLTLKQVDDSIRDIFSSDLVKSVESVYQKTKEGFLLVISIHALEMEDTIVLHTKFIFPVNSEKTGLTDNSFNYLCNLGCGYKHIEFEDDIEDLKSNINNILDNNDFDEELRDLSDFLSQSPDSRINNFFHSKDIENISCHEVRYNPKFKMKPCEDSSYDFTLNINNSDEVDISIEREDKYKIESRFKLTIKLNDIKSVYIDSMNNIGETIAQEIINLYK